MKFLSAFQYKNILAYVKNDWYCGEIIFTLQAEYFLGEGELFMK